MNSGEQKAGPTPPTEEQVLGEIGGMIAELLEDYDLDPAEIAMDSRFTEDLELESVDMVALSERLQQRWGEQVNLAELIAGLELDEIVGLTVGRLVRHVVNQLRTAERS